MGPLLGTNGSATILTLLTIFLTLYHCQVSRAADPQDYRAENLLRAGTGLVERKHYLEAFDHLEEARDIMEKAEHTNTTLYADILFGLAEAKIKARLHQGFPAHYVKTALEEVQIANKLRERLSGVMPQKLAEGYFLEGYIQKTFFMRYEAAAQIFARAVSVDPGLMAAKRELSELVSDEKQK
jgi:tetratricopeptide (TPR) repeat protein